MYRRLIERTLREALADRPVVLLHGARQTGKSTLVQSFVERMPGTRYFTLDDPTVLSAASADPDGFLASIEGPIAIDEVQRAPDLLRAIKLLVDRRRQPGRFLLTGSADVLTVPRISESLAGRMEVQRLWPLAQAEVESSAGTFLDAVFAPKLPKLAVRAGSRRELVERVVRGGYPEVVGMKSDRRRRAWFASYVTAILQRDVRDLANVENLALFPRLLGLVAARAPGLLSYSDLARALGMPQTTLKRYLALLTSTFLVTELPAWSANVGSRLVKAPKVFIADSGLAAYLLGLGPDILAAAPDARAGMPEAFGKLLESFVAMEIARLATWSDESPALYHFRTHAGREVDLVLEGHQRRLVGIEVKSSASVSAADFAGLRALAELAPDRFHRGLVLYAGDAVVPFGPSLHAVPVGALWDW